MSIDFLPHRPLSWTRPPRPLWVLLPIKLSLFSTPIKQKHSKGILKMLENVFSPSCWYIRLYFGQIFWKPPWNAKCESDAQRFRDEFLETITNPFTKPRYESKWQGWDNNYYRGHFCIIVPSLNMFTKFGWKSRQSNISADINKV